MLNSIIHLAVVIDDDLTRREHEDSLSASFAIRRNTVNFSEDSSEDNGRTD